MLKNVLYVPVTLLDCIC